MTTRRAFISTLAGGLLAAPLAAAAQQSGKVPRIGFLWTRTPSEPGPETDSEPDHALVSQMDEKVNSIFDFQCNRLTAAVKKRRMAIVQSGIV